MRLAWALAAAYVWDLARSAVENVQEIEHVALLPWKRAPVVPLVTDLDAMLGSALPHLDATSTFSNADAGVFVVDKNSTNGSGTFLVLCRNDDLYDLLETIQSIGDRYGVPHDWVLLNDQQFLPHFVATVSGAVKSGRVSFGTVPKAHWGYPNWVDQTHAALRRRRLHRENVVYGDSELYRHMCRYYLGFFFDHPLLVPYSYFWRVEPGVRYYCDMDNVFAVMAEQKRLYGFAILLFEYAKTIGGLWETTRAHFQPRSNIPPFNRASPVGPDSLLPFVTNDDGSYNLCHFWLNFEVASLDFFRLRQYRAYFRALDAAGGFFYERWGDAPVHTLAVANLLPRDKVWWFGNVGYLHAPYLQCPQSDVFYERRCACDPHMDFTFDKLSCTPHFLDVLTGA